MTRSLKSSKLRQPAQPASATVVTPDAQREAVRVDAVVAGVGALLAGARVDVDVDVDEAGGHVEARDVDDLEGLGGVDPRGDRGDLAVGDGHVADGAHAVLRVDDVAAPEQQVVLRLGRGARGDGRSERQARATRRPERVMAHALPGGVPLGRPARAQVLAHVEGARHLVAGDGAR